MVSMPKVRKQRALHKCLGLPGAAMCSASAVCQPDSAFFIHKEWQGPWKDKGEGGDKD